MSDDVNCILDIFETKNQIPTPPKPMYKAEKTKRILLNKDDHQKQSKYDDSLFKNRES